MVLRGGEKKLPDWRQDKRWSDRFIPEIKSILGIHLIGEPPVEEDQERNTDLMVLRMEVLRIGCRIRRPGYLEQYGGEFTIRAGRPSGAKTELTKIIEGWGDYFFNAHAGRDERLKAWWLADLKVFRLWFNEQLWKGERPWHLKSNRDGSSNFLIFKWCDMPADFIAATGRIGEGPATGIRTGGEVK